MINCNIDKQVKAKRIQIKKDFPNFASEETRKVMQERDDALKKSKTTRNNDDVRNFKILRNRAHKMLKVDKIIQIKNKFEDAKNNPRLQWKTTKEEAGWAKNLSPDSINKDGKTIRNPKGIADAINLAQITRNLKLHREVPKTNTDFKVNYRKLTAGKNLNFQLRTITMSQLKQEIKEMRPAPSAGMDGISMKTMKKIIKPLYSPLLNLVNTCFETADYPDNLKTARIVPLLKQGKKPNEAVSYRGVNILPTLGKIVDRIVNKQLVRHLVSNNLLIHQHHGAIKGRSTMTAVTTMLYDWAESLEKGENNAILVLDQSAAYDIICHEKLVQKLEILGSNSTTTTFFKNYLKQRRQSVTVESFQSDTLESGPLSVCQGSTLSGSLYLVYTLDYPLIFNHRKLSLQEYDVSRRPRTTTFVDDSSVKIQLSTDKDDNNAKISQTLDQVKDYMNANTLVLNQDKSKIMVLTKDDQIRRNISIKIPNIDKPILPLKTMTFLGIKVQDDLKWNVFLTEGKDNLVLRLRQKLNAIKKIRKYLDTKTTKMIINGIFHSRLLYGSCLWVGAPDYLKKKSSDCPTGGMQGGPGLQNHEMVYQETIGQHGMATHQQITRERDSNTDTQNT